MMNNKKKLPKLLYVIALLALIIRLWGIDYGLPSLIMSPDEPPVMNAAMSFGRGSFEPLFYNYPTLYMYTAFLFFALYFGVSLIFGLIHAPQEFLMQYLTNPTNFYLIARGISALAGTFTIIATYFVARRIFDKKVALIASAFLAVSTLHVQYSHYALPEALMTLISTVSLYYILGIKSRGAFKDYALSGLFLGLAIATKYTAGLLIIALFAAHYFRTGGMKTALFSKKIFTSMASALIGFLMGAPYWLLSFDKYYSALSFLSIQRWLEHPAQLGLKWIWVFEQMVLKEHLLGVIFIVAVIYAIKKHTEADVILVLPLILYFVYVGSWNMQGIHYFISIFPILCILSARLFVKAFAADKYKKIFLALFYFVFISALFFAASFGYEHTKKDTRLLSLEFVENNIPSGSNIAGVSQYYGPAFKSEEDLSEINAKFKKYGINISLDENIASGPYYVRTNLLFVADTPAWPEHWNDTEIEKYSGSGYLQLLYSHRMRTVPELKALGAEYLIISDNLYKNVINWQSNTQNPLDTYFSMLRDYYQKIIYDSGDDLELIKFFDNNNSPGPIIYIYAIN